MSTDIGVERHEVPPRQSLLPFQLGHVGKNYVAPLIHRIDLMLMLCVLRAGYPSS